MYKKIGVVVAMTSELEDVQQVFGRLVNEHGFTCFNVKEFLSGDKKFYVVCGGVGNILAAMATQFLVEKFAVQAVVNFGLAGGLSDLCVGKQELLVDKIVPYDFNFNVADKSARGVLLNTNTPYIQVDYSMFPWISKLKLKSVVCASADKFVNSAEYKNDLVNSFGADVCEMEAYGIITVCAAYKIPCIMIKAISDMADESAMECLSDIATGKVDFYMKSLQTIVENI